MSANEWKVKYYDLRQKVQDATDTAYRLGYEQGAKETQMEMQAQQQAEQAALEAQMNGQMPVDENGNPIPQDQMPPEEAQAGMEMEGEELPPDVDPEVSQQLDDHINELESLVAKGEKPSIKDMRKVVTGLSSLRKSQKSKWAGKVKKDSSAQKKFVDNILAKWDKEIDPTKELEDQIRKEGLKLED